MTVTSLRRGDRTDPASASPGLNQSTGRPGRAILCRMDGADLDQALYARMRWNAPLSAEHAGLLMDRLDLRPGLRITDLGCGWGELLLQAVARAMTAGPSAARQATGTGVDTDADALGRAQTLARQRHLDQHADFTQADAAAWRGAADRALCVGASHAFGGTEPALTALAQVTVPGGRLLFGDGYWASTPSPAAITIFGEAVPSLPQLLETCRAAGWRVIHMSTADQREWDPAPRKSATGSTPANASTSRHTAASSASPTSSWRTDSAAARKRCS
jgi:SAM-dependent methyltransferase